MRQMLPLALSLTLLLSACGGSSQDPTVACASRYWDGTVGTCLPAGWHVVDRDVMRDRGLSGEVVAAFQADQAISGQFPSVIVTRELLSREMTSKQYSDASVQAVGSLPQYEVIDQRTSSIEGQQLTLHIFSAQLREDQPKQRFYQISAVSGRNGYTFTAAMPLSVDEDAEQRVLLILQNAAFHDLGTVEE